MCCSFGASTIIPTMLTPTFMKIRQFFFDNPPSSLHSQKDVFDQQQRSIVALNLISTPRDQLFSSQELALFQKGGNVMFYDAVFRSPDL